MKALRFHKYGGPEVLQFDEVPIPEPGEGEILVKVAGSGVNPIDWKVREGFMNVPLPAIVGWEFSGTVEKLGPGVDAFQIGDEVYGVSRTGATAEYAVAQASQTGYKPAGMDLPDAAAVPIAASTAWNALFTRGGLEAGQRVFLQAAAGGVGTFAIQFAKWKGATVIGTASAKNHHLLQELGADELIDYRTTDYGTAVKDVDVVIETIGGEENMRKSLAILKPGGILVSLVGPGPEEEAKAQGKRVAFFSNEADTAQLNEIAGLIQNLQVRPVIDTVVPLNEAVEAQKESQTGHVVGKIVVRIAG